MTLIFKALTNNLNSSNLENAPKITVDPYRKMMVIRSVEEPYIEVFCEDIFVKRKGYRSC